MLTGTESSAERSEAELTWPPEKRGSHPGNSSFHTGKSLQSLEPTNLPSPSHSSSGGNSIKSSIWSNKFPQSISSMKLGPITSILCSRNFAERKKKYVKEEHGKARKKQLCRVLTSKQRECVCVCESVKIFQKRFRQQCEDEVEGGGHQVW